MNTSSLLRGEVFLFCLAKGGFPTTSRMRWLLLLLVLVGCSSPKPSEVLDPRATLLVQTKVAKAVVMVGTMPEGEWVIGVHHGDSGPNAVLFDPTETPETFLDEGVAVVAAKAPAGAATCELLTDQRKVIKGKVANGACLVAWAEESENPGFILVILDAKQNELYRWPPPGGLPAA